MPSRLLPGYGDLLHCTPSAIYIRQPLFCLSFPHHSLSLPPYILRVGLTSNIKNQTTMADNKAERKTGNVAIPATDVATAQAAEQKKKIDDQARIREILAKKKAERAAAAAAEANQAPPSNGADNNAAEKKKEKSAVVANNKDESSSKNGRVDDEARLREMLSKKKIMHKKNRRASKSEDPSSETAGRKGDDKKSPNHPDGYGRHENDSRGGGGRDYRRDRPHHGRGGGYNNDRRRDDRGWRNNNDRGGYGRGRDNYWDGRGRGGGGWRDESRDYGGRGGYPHEREIPARDRSRGRSRSRSFSRSSSGSRSRSYSSSDGSRSSGSYSSRSHSRSYSRSVSRSPSVDSHYSETQDQKRKRSDSAGNEKKKHRRSSSKSKTDAENALTKDQRTILVSQLVMKADEYDIRRYFKRKVGVKVNDVILLRDKRTGRHKGIAYVELCNLEEVDTALEASGKTPDFQRFPILVKRTEAEKNVAGMSVTASSDSTTYQLTADGKRIEAQKVYIGSIDRAVTQAQLYSLFSQFGKLDNVLLQMDMATGISKGFAFLSYPDPKDANLAIQTMSGQMLAGRPLKTGWANQQSSAAGVQEVRSDEFPTDSNEKIEKVNQVLMQLTGSGLTTMLSQIDPSQQQALLAAGPAGALGILPSAQLASVADAALDLALGNTPSNGALSPAPVNVAAATPMIGNPTVDAPSQPPVIASEPAASTQPSIVDDAKIVGRIDRPSNHILVHNMFDKDEETEPGWEEDIKLDFEEECAQYGKISSVVVMSKEVGGKIYATFDAVDGAMSCAKNLAGRWFDKRQLRVEFVDSIP